MLPVPMVAESAVQSAAKELTSPETPSPSSVWNMYTKARFRLKMCANLRLSVRISPVTRTAPMSGIPHTQFETASIILQNPTSRFPNLQPKRNIRVAALPARGSRRCAAARTAISSTRATAPREAGTARRQAPASKRRPRTRSRQPSGRRPCRTLAKTRS